MGYLIHIYFNNHSVLLKFFRLISIGISGDSNEEYYTSTLHLGLWKLELTTSIGWRRNAKKENK
tara:strand:- start:277 stop:468 length:192 start_codon:yes stop_codon:yes gene_type:complete